MIITMLGGAAKASIVANRHRVRKIRLNVFILLRSGSGEERVVFLLLLHCGQRTVSGANQCVSWQAEDLLAHLLLCQRTMLPGSAHGAGEDGVADDGDMRRILRPVADDVCDAVFRM